MSLVGLRSMIVRNLHPLVRVFEKLKSTGKSIMSFRKSIENVCRGKSNKGYFVCPNTIVIPNVVHF